MDIWLLIMQFLCPQDLLRCGGTCHLFYQASRNNKVWEKFAKPFAEANEWCAEQLAPYWKWVPWFPVGTPGLYSVICRDLIRCNLEPLTGKEVPVSYLHWLKQASPRSSDLVDYLGKDVERTYFSDRGSYIAGTRAYLGSCCMHVNLETCLWAQLWAQRRHRFYTKGVLMFV